MAYENESKASMQMLILAQQRLHSDKADVTAKCDCHLTKIPRPQPVPQGQICDLVSPLDELAEWHQHVEIQKPQEGAWPQEQDVVDCLHNQDRIQ